MLMRCISSYVYSLWSMSRTSIFVLWVAMSCGTSGVTMERFPHTRLHVVTTHNTIDAKIEFVQQELYTKFKQNPSYNYGN